MTPQLNVAQVRTFGRVMPRLLLSAGLVITLSFCLFPVLWQFITAIKPSTELTTLPPFFPAQPTLEHFHRVFTERPFARIVLNSTGVAVLTTIVCLALGAPAAFALAKLQVPGRQGVMLAILAVSMFPPIAIVSSLFLLIRLLYLRDTWWALILADATFALPLTIWVLTSFFRDVSDDLLRAARVDGCTAWQALLYVFLPVAAPGLATAALLTFVFVWNEFLFALTFTATEASRTVPVEVSLFPGLHEIPWGELAAASLIVTLPVLVIVVIMQRRLVTGLTAGAVKG